MAQMLSRPEQCDYQKYDDSQSNTESHYCHKSLEIAKLNNDWEQSMKRTGQNYQEKKKLKLLKFTFPCDWNLNLEVNQDNPLSTNGANANALHKK